MNSGAYEAVAGSCYVIFRCLAKTCKGTGPDISVEVLEPSVIYEDKDGKYSADGNETFKI